LVQNSLLVSLQPEPGSVLSGRVDSPIYIVGFNVNRQVGYSYGTSWKESRVNQVFITVQVHLQQITWKQKLHQNVLVCTSLNIIARLTSPTLRSKHVQITNYNFDKNTFKQYVA